MRIALLAGLAFTAASGIAQTFNGSGGLIPDNNTATDFIINVGGLSPSTLDQSHGLVGVCITITHTWDSDLDAKLIAPDGTVMTLFSGVGGDGDNFTSTCFDQNAASSINTGSAPFTGNFKPQSNLGNANNGQNGNGNWILRITDQWAQDQGNLLNWSITFGNNAPIPFAFSSTNIPLVILNTGGNTIPDEPKINGTMKVIDYGPVLRNHPSDIANIYDGNIGIEMRGAYSQSLPQKPYNVELRDNLGAQLDSVILGMPAEHDWHLIANYNDKSFLRNALAYKLFAEAGNYATRFQFCEVLLNNEYQGIYMYTETIKRDANRVDIAKLDTNENAGRDLTGGYIIKNDYWDNSNSWLLNYHPIDHPSYDVHLVYHYPKPDVITPQQKTYIATFINDFETKLYDVNFQDTSNNYLQYADLTSFLDYFIINELARNNDGFKKSSYFHKDKDPVSGWNKLFAGPVWDFDWAWKNIWGCSIFEATDGSGWAHHINDCGPDVNSPGWYVRMMSDTNFQNSLRCRYENLRHSILDTTYLFNYIDSMSNVLDESQQRHYEYWGHMGLNTGAPEVESPSVSYSEEVLRLKNWIRLRIEWLDNNIPGNTVACSWTSTPELTLEKTFRMFPNPANEFVVIEINENASSIDGFVLRDMQGKMLLQIPNTGAKNHILQTSGLSSGIYLLESVNRDGITNGYSKLIVAH